MKSQITKEDMIKELKFYTVGLKRIRPIDKFYPHHSIWSNLWWSFYNKFLFPYPLNKKPIRKFIFKYILRYSK